MAVQGDMITEDVERSADDREAQLRNWKLRGTVISTAIVLLGVAGTLGLCILSVNVIAMFTE